MILLKLKYLIKVDDVTRLEDKCEYAVECDKLVRLESVKDVAWRDYERTKGKWNAHVLPKCFNNLSRPCFEINTACDVMKRMECKNAYNWCVYKNAERRYKKQLDLVNSFWNMRMHMRVD